MKQRILSLSCSVFLLSLFGCHNAPNTEANTPLAPAKVELANSASLESKAITVATPKLDACAVPASTTWYLHLSDIHLGADVQTQQPNGDTSVPLWEATKTQLRKYLGGPNPPAFIVCTGDLPDHAPDHGEKHTANVKAVLADLRTLAGTIPLLYLPGNNDSLDWDYASFTSATGETPLRTAGWSGPTLNVAVSEGNAAQGYYSAVPVPGLRVVALNTVLFSASYPCKHQPSPATGTCSDQQAAQATAQLVWLDTQLKAAGSAKQKVLLAMHIPPGVDAFSSPKLMWKDSNWQDRLLAMIDTSPSEIVGLAYGHTHLDELRRLYNGNGKLELIALSAPGITPGHGNNPGFKAVFYDAGFHPTDVLTWYATASGPEAVDFQYRDDTCYRYSQVFGCDGKTFAACIGDKPLGELNQAMDTIYNVKRSPFVSGAKGYYDTAPGIDVHPVGKPSAGPAGVTKARNR